MKRFSIFLWVFIVVAVALSAQQTVSADTLYYADVRLQITDGTPDYAQAEELQWQPLNNPFARLPIKWREVWIKIPLPAALPDHAYLSIPMDAQFITIYPQHSSTSSNELEQTLLKYQKPRELMTRQITAADVERGYLLAKLKQTHPPELMRLFGLQFGSQHAILQAGKETLRSAQISDQVSFFIGNALLLFGLLALFIFISRIKKRDYPFLIFGIMASFSGILSWLMSSYSSYMHSFVASKRMLWGISYLLLFFLLQLFIRFLFKNRKFWIVLGVLTLWAGCILLTVYGHLRPYYLRSASFVFTIIMLLYVQWCIIKDHRFSRGKKMLLSGGFLLFFGFMLMQTTRIGMMHRNLLSPFGGGFLTLAVIFTYFLLDHMVKAEREMEEQRLRLMQLQQENLTSQLATLRNQIDPHFLFNNFNTLLSLIETEPPLAATFVEQLSQVYRYILQIRDKDLIPIADEMEFVTSYMYLLRTRFRDHLVLDADLSGLSAADQVPPLSIQTLLENAVKHNIVSPEKPLTISLRIEDNALVVQNNLQPKRILEHSSGLGLENLRKRYSYFSTTAIQIDEDASHFCVRLPIIKGDQQ